jgi:hypothetical protein
LDLILHTVHTKKKTVITAQLMAKGPGYAARTLFGKLIMPVRAEANLGSADVRNPFCFVPGFVECFI